MKKRRGAQRFRHPGAPTTRWRPVLETNRESRPKHGVVVRSDTLVWKNQGVPLLPLHRGQDLNWEVSPMSQSFQGFWAVQPTHIHAHAHFPQLLAVEGRGLFSEAARKGRCPRNPLCGDTGQHQTPSPFSSLHCGTQAPPLCFFLPLGRGWAWSVDPMHLMKLHGYLG